MANIDRMDGGYATARLTAAEQDRLARQERQELALRWLRRRGLDDIAEILGLAEPATPGRSLRRLNGHRLARKEATP